jgi:hypothetical protein
MSVKRLPARLPVGSKYVLESRGRMKGSILVHRYVELPDGQRIELAARLVPTSSAESIDDTAVPRAAKTRDKAPA